MKNIFITLTLYFFGLVLVAQEPEAIDLLSTDETWRKEAFEFPIPFAQEINFDGVADVRFTEGWGDKESEQFWSYVFAWHIKLSGPLSESELEEYMKVYFDGLMNVVNQDKSFEVPPSVTLFSAYEADGENLIKGKIRLYDAFFTKEIMTLNVSGDYEYCESDGKSIYFLRLSPQDQEHHVWTHLSKVNLQEGLCK